MHCIYCGCLKIHKRGKTKRGNKKYQRYICDKCQRSFSELSGTIYENRNLTPADIDLVLKYRNRGMNFSQIAKIVGVSSKAVSNLIKNELHEDSVRSDDQTRPINLISNTNSND